MKKTMLILWMITLPFVLHAQAYQSLIDVSEVKDTEIIEKTRNIMINPDKIMVSPYGDDRLYLKVNRTEKKAKAFDGMATWYYCQDDEATKFIIIVPEATKPKKIELYQVIDEVTFIRKQFILN